MTPITSPHALNSSLYPSSPPWTKHRLRLGPHARPTIPPPINFHNSTLHQCLQQRIIAISFKPFPLPFPLRAVISLRRIKPEHAPSPSHSWPTYPAAATQLSTSSFSLYLCTQRFFSIDTQCTQNNINATVQVLTLLFVQGVPCPHFFAPPINLVLGPDIIVGCNSRSRMVRGRAGFERVRPSSGASVRTMGLLDGMYIGGIPSLGSASLLVSDLATTANDQWIASLGLDSMILHAASTPKGPKMHQCCLESPHCQGLSFSVLFAGSIAWVHVAVRCRWKERISRILHMRQIRK